MTPTAGCVMMVVMYCAVTSALECSTISALVSPKHLRVMKSGSVQSVRSV